MSSVEDGVRRLRLPFEKLEEKVLVMTVRVVASHMAEALDEGHFTIRCPSAAESDKPASEYGITWSKEETKDSKKDKTTQKNAADLSAIAQAFYGSSKQSNSRTGTGRRTTKRFRNDMTPQNLFPGPVQEDTDSEAQEFRREQTKLEKVREALQIEELLKDRMKNDDDTLAMRVENKAADRAQLLKVYSESEYAMESPIEANEDLVRIIGRQLFTKPGDDEYAQTPTRPSTIKLDPVRHHSITFVCKTWTHNRLARSAANGCVVRDANDVKFEDLDKNMSTLLQLACEYAYGGRIRPTSREKLRHAFRDGSCSAFIEGREVVRVPPLHFPAWKHVMVRTTLMRGGNRSIFDVLPSLLETTMDVDGTLYYEFAAEEKRVTLENDDQHSLSFLAGAAYLNVYDLVMSEARVPRLPYDGLGPVDAANVETRTANAWMSGRKVYLMGRARNFSRPMCFISTCTRDECRMPYVCMGSLRVADNVEASPHLIEKGNDLYNEYNIYQMLQHETRMVVKITNFANPPYVTSLSAYMDENGAENPVNEAEAESLVAEKLQAEKKEDTEEARKQAWGPLRVRTSKPKRQYREQTGSMSNSRFTFPWRTRKIALLKNARNRRGDDATRPQLTIACADLGKDVLTASARLTHLSLLMNTLDIAKRHKTDVVVLQHVQLSSEFYTIVESRDFAAIPFEAQTADEDANVDAPLSTILLVRKGGDWGPQRPSMVVRQQPSEYVVLESCVLHSVLKHKPTSRTCSVTSAVQSSDAFRAAFYDHTSIAYSYEDLANAKKAFNKTVLSDDSTPERSDPTFIVATLDDVDHEELSRNVPDVPDSLQSDWEEVEEANFDKYWRQTERLIESRKSDDDRLVELNENIEKRVKSIASAMEIKGQKKYYVWKYSTDVTYRASKSATESATELATGLATNLAALASQAVGGGAALLSGNSASQAVEGGEKNPEAKQGEKKRVSEKPKIVLLPNRKFCTKFKDVLYQTDVARASAPTRDDMKTVFGSRLPSVAAFSYALLGLNLEKQSEIWLQEVLKTKTRKEAQERIRGQDLLVHDPPQSNRFKLKKRTFKDRSARRKIYRAVKSEADAATGAAATQGFGTLYTDDPNGRRAWQVAVEADRRAHEWNVAGQTGPFCIPTEMLVTWKHAHPLHHDLMTKNYEAVGPSYACADVKMPDDDRRRARMNSMHVFLNSQSSRSVADQKGEAHVKVMTFEILT